MTDNIRITLIVQRLFFPAILLGLLTSCASNARFTSKQYGNPPRPERGLKEQKKEADSTRYNPEEKPVPRQADASEKEKPTQEEFSSGFGKLYQEGIASYYAHEFNGRRTANGEQFNMNGLTAAHQTLPFNTKVRVENKTNGKAVLVRINDRGPFAKNRIIDLSLGAAKQIELIGPGSAPVKLYIMNDE